MNTDTHEEASRLDRQLNEMADSQLDLVADWNRLKVENEQLRAQVSGAPVDGADTLALLGRVLRLLEEQYREYVHREGVNRQHREALEQEMTIIAHLMDEARGLP